MEFDHIVPPPTAFYFNVSFIGPLPIRDMSFLEVSGVTVELETQEIEVGGGDKRMIPVRRKHGNLVCKRPLQPVRFSALSAWTDVTMAGAVDIPIMTSDIMVTLLDSLGCPTCGWYIAGAYPVKWEVAGFDSKKNDIALESIEFSYNTVTRVL